MPTKARDTSHTVTYSSIWRKGLDGTVTIIPGSSGTWKGRQVTVSSGHRKSRDGKYRSGGPFFTYRVDPSPQCGAASLDVTQSGIRHKYGGPITMPIPKIGGAGSGSSANTDQDSSYLDKVGAEAISIVDPTNPNAQLGVTLGEVGSERGITLPGITSWRRRTEVAKAAAGEYLAAQFGWLPLVSEMKATAQSIKDGNRIMENYSSNSGKDTHREFAFDDIVDVEETIVNPATRCVYSSTNNVGAFSGTAVPLTRRRETTKKRWFSGSFTYAASQAPSLGRCLGLGSEADKLFGLTLTPDVVWELTPWSWAIDWFSNAGNVISNATSFGLAGLVMRYGYIMEETTIVDTYSMPHSGLRSDSAGPRTASVKSTVKRRAEANPFGFGVGWEGLSPTQLAITAALGITRLR